MRQDDRRHRLEADGGPVDGRAPVLVGAAGRVDVDAEAVQRRRRRRSECGAIRDPQVADVEHELIQLPGVVGPHEVAEHLAVQRDAVHLGGAPVGRCHVDVERRQDERGRRRHDPGRDQRARVDQPSIGIDRPDPPGDFDDDLERTVAAVRAARVEAAPAVHDEQGIAGGRWCEGRRPGGRRLRGHRRGQGPQPCTDHQRARDRPAARSRHHCLAGP